VTSVRADGPWGDLVATATNGSFVLAPNEPVTFNENGSCMVTVQALSSSTNTSFSVRPVMVHVASNASVQQPQFSPASYASGANVSGYLGTATAVLTTNQLGAWRLGCELSTSSGIYECRISYLCN